MIVRNTYTQIVGINPKIVRKIMKATSYRVKGSYFSKAYREHHWDGKMKLLKYGKKKGYNFPTGLLPDVRRILRDNEISFKIVDKRRLPKKRINFIYDEGDKPLRHYQEKAVEKILTGKLDYARGILKMPIRSGKTRTVARLIKEVGVKTLFIVPSKLLLRQTCETLESLFHEEIGIVGDSQWVEGRITVATIQTILRAKGGTFTNKETGEQYKINPREEYKKLLKNYDMIIMDEVHHLTADQWRKIFQSVDAPYRIGLSATAYLDNEEEQEKGSIWLKACCGPIRFNLSTSFLIKKGYLVQPRILLYEIDKPTRYFHLKWSHTIAKEVIYENKFRNRRIALLAKRYAETGRLVLISTSRVSQVRSIIEELEDLGVYYSAIIGRTPSNERAERIDDFVSKRVNVLLGTVFTEGVDIPEIDVVVNAEGGKDVKKTIQRMRNLTPHEGKEKAIFIDFIDYTNKYFLKHSLARFRTYREEKSFLIKKVEFPSSQKIKN